MKKAYGSWVYEDPYIEIFCPYCDEYCDEDVFSDLDEGEHFKGKIKCNKCNKSFIAEIDG